MAHVMTAQLLWHVQKFVVIWLQKKSTYSSLYFLKDLESLVKILGEMFLPGQCWLACVWDCLRS